MHNLHFLWSSFARKTTTQRSVTNMDEDVNKAAIEFHLNGFFESSMRDDYLAHFDDKMELYKLIRVCTIGDRLICTQLTNRIERDGCNCMQFFLIHDDSFEFLGDIKVHSNGHSPYFQRNFLMNKDKILEDVFVEIQIGQSINSEYFQKEYSIGTNIGTNYWMNSNVVDLIIDAITRMRKERKTVRFYLHIS